MKRRFLSAAALISVLAVAACGGGTSSKGAADPDAEINPNATVSFQTGWAASTLDPHKSPLGGDALFLNMIYDRLVHRSTSGDAVPGLAESWEFKDGTELILHLRQGVTFHDGTPFDADAVKANLERAMEPENPSAAFLSMVDSVEVVDPATVLLKLSGPGGALLLTLSDLPGMMVSPKAFATDAAEAKIATAPVGAGRYTVADFEAGARYELKAYDGYWDKDAVGAKTFIWSVVVDPQTRLNAVSSGDADLIQASTTIIAPAGARQDLVVRAQNTLNSHTLNFNRTKSEFDKIEARQAVLYAINRDEIIAGALDGEAVPATQPYPKGYLAHNDALDSTYGHDLDKAKELLASAGLENGFAFEVLVLNVPQIVREAEIIKAQLAKVKIDMKITPYATADIAAAFNGGTGDAIMTAWAGRGDPTSMLTQYFSEGARGNPSLTAPAGFTEAIAAANSSYDPAERAALLGEVSKTLMDEAAYAPLAFFSQGAILRNNVVGYQPYLNSDEFRGVGIAK